jgi:hypothetical protein
MLMKFVRGFALQKKEAGKTYSSLNASTQASANL